MNRTTTLAEFTVEIPSVSSAHVPHIYDGAPPPQRGAMCDHYGIFFPLEAVPPEVDMTGIRTRRQTRGRDGHPDIFAAVWAKATHRVPVDTHPGWEASLVDRVQWLDASNRRRDDVFLDQRVVLGVSAYEWQTGRGPGRWEPGAGFRLTSILIHPH